VSYALSVSRFRYSNVNSMQATQPSPEECRRPILLTLICVFAVVGAVMNLWRVIFGPPSKLGEWFLPSLAISSIVGIIAMVGVWQMRCWGAYTYIGLCIVGQIELIVMLGHFNWTALLLRCVVVAALLLYLGRMK
jgi:hypothetical protein